MGRPELAEDERFSGNIGRNNNEPALKEIVEAWTRERTAQEIAQTLLGNGVPVATVRNVKEAIENPQTTARGMVVDIEQPGAGTFKIFGSAIKTTNSVIEARGPAPEHGEHNEWVLREFLGKSEAEAAETLSSGAMGARGKQG
jgi:crotonobetainyl-CoA:carnitine CoA-transferase CaiB-like acyl-CoA transferase